MLKSICNYQESKFCDISFFKLAHRLFGFIGGLQLKCTKFSIIRDILYAKYINSYFYLFFLYYLTYSNFRVLKFENSNTTIYIFQYFALLLWILKIWFNIIINFETILVNSIAFMPKYDNFTKPDPLSLQSSTMNNDYFNRAITEVLLTMTNGRSSTSQIDKLQKKPVQLDYDNQQKPSTSICDKSSDLNVSSDKTKNTPNSFHNTESIFEKMESYSSLDFYSNSSDCADIEEEECDDNITNYNTNFTNCSEILNINHDSDSMDYIEDTKALLSDTELREYLPDFLEKTSSVRKSKRKPIKRTNTEIDSSCFQNISIPSDVQYIETQPTESSPLSSNCDYRASKRKPRQTNSSRHYKNHNTNNIDCSNTNSISDTITSVATKRPVRSTAGKLPARLMSLSPPSKVHCFIPNSSESNYRSGIKLSHSSSAVAATLNSTKLKPNNTLTSTSICTTSSIPLSSSNISNLNLTVNNKKYSQSNNNNDWILLNLRNKLSNKLKKSPTVTTCATTIGNINKSLNSTIDNTLKVTSSKNMSLLKIPHENDFNNILSYPNTSTNAPTTTLLSVPASASSVTSSYSSSLSSSSSTTSEHPSSSSSCTLSPKQESLDKINGVNIVSSFPVTSTDIVNITSIGSNINSNLATLAFSNINSRSNNKMVNENCLLHNYKVNNSPHSSYTSEFTSQSSVESILNTRFDSDDFNGDDMLEDFDSEEMPPPRKTLTLAAMRERMRAKKLARGCCSLDNFDYAHHHHHHHYHRHHRYHGDCDSFVFDESIRGNESHVDDLDEMDEEDDDVERDEGQRHDIDIDIDDDDDDNDNVDDDNNVMFSENNTKIRDGIVEESRVCDNNGEYNNDIDSHNISMLECIGKRNNKEDNCKSGDNDNTDNNNVTDDIEEDNNTNINEDDDDEDDNDDGDDDEDNNSVIDTGAVSESNRDLDSFLIDDSGIEDYQVDIDDDKILNYSDEFDDLLLSAGGSDTLLDIIMKDADSIDIGNESFSTLSSEDHQSFVSSSTTSVMSHSNNNSQMNILKSNSSNAMSELIAHNPFDISITKSPSNNNGLCSLMSKPINLTSSTPITTTSHSNNIVNQSIDSLDRHLISKSEQISNKSNSMETTVVTSIESSQSLMTTNITMNNHSNTLTLNTSTTLAAVGTSCTTTMTKPTNSPNAYLVDGNGLSDALRLIQSLNPGAKVTTQQFYLVNSGPQLVLCQNPPLQSAASTSINTSSCISNSSIIKQEKSEDISESMIFGKSIFQLFPNLETVLLFITSTVLIIIILTVTILLMKKFMFNGLKRYGNSRNGDISLIDNTKSSYASITTTSIPSRARSYFYLQSIDNLPGTYRSTNEIPQELILINELKLSGKFYDIYDGGIKQPKRLPLKVTVYIIKANLQEDVSRKLIEQFYEISHFQHENILNIIGIGCFKGSTAVLLDFTINGTLNTFLKVHGSEIPSCQLIQFARDIAAALAYLSNKCFVHQNLSSHCVYLDETQVCKLSLSVPSTSSSLGQQDDDGLSEEQPIDTSPWLAVELLHNKLSPISEPEQFTQFTDVWAYGVIVWEIFSQATRPYWSWSPATIHQSLMDGYRLPQPNNCRQCLYSLLIQCWSVDPNLRPCFNSILTKIDSIANYVDEKCLQFIDQKLMTRSVDQPNDTNNNTIQVAFHTLPIATNYCQKNSSLDTVLLTDCHDAPYNERISTFKQLNPNDSNLFQQAPIITRGSLKLSNSNNNNKRKKSSLSKSISGTMNIQYPSTTSTLPKLNVTQWLSDLNLKKYSNLFQKNGYDDRKKLANISIANLTQLGIENASDIQVLLNNAQMLK